MLENENFKWKTYEIVSIIHLHFISRFLIYSCKCPYYVTFIIAPSYPYCVGRLEHSASPVLDQNFFRCKHTALLFFAPSKRVRAARLTYNNSVFRRQHRKQGRCTQIPALSLDLIGPPAVALSGVDISEDSLGVNGVSAVLKRVWYLSVHRA